MKVYFMYDDRNFNPDQKLPLNADDLINDLGLKALLQAMADNDNFIMDISKKALILGVDDEETVTYRQEALTDAISNIGVIEQMYKIVTNVAIESHNKFYFVTKPYPTFMIYASISIIEVFLNALNKIRSITGPDIGGFKSEGFRSLFKTLFDELNYSYIESIKEYIKTLGFDNDITVRCELGKGNTEGNKVMNHLWKFKRGQLSGL
ncbi:MAG: hypothetical protein QXI38_04010 [Conexivisphaerales archaeon]